MSQPIIVPETVVYDGRFKCWRILNLSSGTVYGAEFDSRENAYAAIEDGQMRDYRYLVKRVTLEEIRAKIV